MAKPIKRSGRWRIQWFDVNGKRKSATFATYDQARAELRRLEVTTDDDRARRDRLGTGAMTVTEAGERFLENMKQSPQDTPRRFKHRKEAHATAFERHIKPHIGNTPLCDLSPPVLRRWIDLLASTKTERRGEKNEDGRTLSASRIRGVVTTLRQIAKANDIPLVVLLADSLRQKRRRSRPKALQCIEDVRALIAACSDPWFRVAVAIACYCGARLGEVASLRWRHIGEQTITIALSWDGPLKARYEDGDEAARIVPLSPELSAILDAWRKVTNGQDNDHVVLVGGVRPLKEGYDDVAQKTRVACAKAGVTPVTFHALRATYATIAAEQNLPIASLQALLGHADVKTTSIYLRTESARAALDPRARLGAPEPHQAAPESDSLPN